MKYSKKTINVIDIEDTDETLVRFRLSDNHHVSVFIIDGDVVVEGNGTFSVVPGKHNIILTPKRHHEM